MRFLEAVSVAFVILICDQIIALAGREQGCLNVIGGVRAAAWRSYTRRSEVAERALLQRCTSAVAPPPQRRQGASEGRMAPHGSNSSERSFRGGEMAQGIDK